MNDSHDWGRDSLVSIPSNRRNDDNGDYDDEFKNYVFLVPHFCEARPVTKADIGDRGFHRVGMIAFRAEIGDHIVRDNWEGRILVKAKEWKEFSYRLNEVQPTGETK